MKNENLKTLKELIDNFDIDYYDQEIDRLQEEIININMGRPRYEGIYNLINSDIVPKNQKEKEIKKLQNKINDNRQTKKELGQALDKLVLLSNKLERLAEQDLLLDVLSDRLRLRGNEELGKTKIYKENSREYLKLYTSSIKPITHSQQKISKEMYKIIKENIRKYAQKTSYGYRTIGSALETNEIDLHIKDKDQLAPGNQIFKDFQKEYRGFPYSPKLAELGVDINVLDHANRQFKGDLDSGSLTWQGKEAFDKVKNIERVENSKIETKGGIYQLRGIKEKYDKIIELSRETWYVEEILMAFSKTAITQTEMYKGLGELVREQELELTKLTREADKLYEKTALQTKLDLVEQLEELYNKTQELNFKIQQFKQNGYERQADLVEQDYHKLRYQMVKILKDNPDLNDPKYGINIESIIKKEMELLEPELKKEVVKEESSYTKADQEKISTHIEVKEEMPEKKAHIDESVKVESLELDSNLQIFRTRHYQDYMREKVFNSDLGKLSFSEYLETVAPHLVQLINIEKEREKLARTIYKDYLKYYSALENKKEAIEFYEFAGNNYGISNVDVPIEYDEEYKGMMKR